MKNFLKNPWVIVGLLVVIAFFSYGEANAYGECDEYGLWVTYNSYSNTCKCMTGYVFDKNFLGQDYCVSGDSVCRDKYGYGSRYDSLDGSCECSYGYVLGTDFIGRTQCITKNQACKNQLGYNARSYLGQCTCNFGYVISGGKCTDGDTVCRNKHGIYSSYTDYSNKCECDDGYTLDDYSQCVKKQNNVYFLLKEIDTDNKEAIIQSDYNRKYYHIRYGIGCLSSSFQRYLNKKIIVNLGTDFDLDIFDKIVLQDHGQTCSIRSRTRVDSSFTMAVEEVIYVPNYIPATHATPTPIPTRINPTPTPVQAPSPTPITCKDGSSLSLSNDKCIKIPSNAHTVSDGKNVWLCDVGYLEKGNSCVLDSSGPVITATPSPSVEPLVPEQKRHWFVRIFRFWEWF